MTTALLDLAAGVAQVGPVRLQVASASPPGAVSVVGCALRPVTLGERSRVVALARTAADPRQALADLVLNLSVMGAPPQDRVPAAMVALALAGAGAAPGSVSRISGRSRPRPHGSPAGTRTP